MNSRTAAMPPEEGIGATRISLYCSEERAEISSDLECSGVERAWRRAQEQVWEVSDRRNNQDSSGQDDTQAVMVHWFIEGMGTCLEVNTHTKFYWISHGQFVSVTREQWTVPRHSDPFRSFFCCKLFKETTNSSSDERPHRILVIRFKFYLLCMCEQ